MAVINTSFVVLVIVLGYEAPDNPDGDESETCMNVIGNLLLGMEIVVSCCVPGPIPPPLLTLYTEPSAHE